MTTVRSATSTDPAALIEAERLLLLPSSAALCVKRILFPPVALFLALLLPSASLLAQGEHGLSRISFFKLSARNVLGNPAYTSGWIVAHSSGARLTALARSQSCRSRLK